jgi:hypothetical protein
MLRIRRGVNNKKFSAVFVVVNLLGPYDLALHRPAATVGDDVDVVGPPFVVEPFNGFEKLVSD